MNTPAIVFLRDLVEELQMLTNESHVYLSGSARDEAYKEIAISWLESNGFAYNDDLNKSK